MKKNIYENSDTLRDADITENNIFLTSSTLDIMFFRNVRQKIFKKQS